ncbi:MAG: glycosyltransferase [Chloroflexota bacterium]|nr:MAG: glycosyltransferase [Chloroflexota bacterium]
MGLISLIVPISKRVNRQVLRTGQLENLASKVAEHDFEFILVGNGSHQDSIRVLREKAENDKRYRLIILTRDFGPPASFLAGITYASGDCVGYFSESIIDPCLVFEKLIHHWESDEKIVFGIWTDSNSKGLNNQHTLERGTFLRRKLFPNRIYFEDISSLLIDKEVYYILSQITDPFSDIIETLVWTGFQPHLVECSFQVQDDGQRSVIFKEQSLHLEYSLGYYSPKTFQTSLSIGLFLSMLGGLAALGLVVASEYYQPSLPVWWLLGAIVVLIIGVQLGLMGVFGEHLYKSLEKIRSRPVFVIDSIVNPPVSSEKEGREKIEKMILSLWSIRKQKAAYSSSMNSLSTNQEGE